MPKFRKKPVVIEAARITRPITISTPEGEMQGEIGNWLITGVAGEQYPCTNNIFRETYEPADEEARTMLTEPTPGRASTPTEGDTANQ